MIFPLIETEPVVQVADKTRLSAVKSFKSNDEGAFVSVKIKPEDSGSFINVTGAAPFNSKNWYLDWAYTTSGTKIVTLEIVTATSTTTFTKTIGVVTEADDKLWSSDDDLVQYEPDIMNWVRAGRASFKDYHRLSQKRILEWLDNIKVWNKDGEPFTKNDITLAIANEDLKRISVFWTLEAIFGGLSNKPDDVFAVKEKAYRASRKEVLADRSRIRADYNKDGVIEKGEQYQLRSIRLSR